MFHDLTIFTFFVELAVTPTLPFVHYSNVLFRESFDNIYLDLSKQPGKCKLAESGLGWKPSGGGETFTLDSSNVGAAQWSRAAKGFELKILSRSSGVIQLDGFDQEAFKIWYGINVESREHALRGWNWGKAEFTKAELSFNVQNRPAFEVPYSEISNTNLAGKNEVAVELALNTDGADANAQPAGSTKNRGRKAASGPDELVEMRFYIPGTVMKTEKGIKEENGEEENGEEEEEGEEQNAANLFYEMLMEKAEIGDVAGDTFATFLDVLHLTPSHHGHSGVKCSIKANEGLLYFLDKSLIFVPKPATYIQVENIAIITMSRVGGAVSASRTFDITVSLKAGMGEHQFTKNIRFKNEMSDDAGALLAAALDNDVMGSSDDEGVRADRGSADEDEESIDEDFQAESESDVAEEYDSAHESSGSGSDAEMNDASDGGGDDDDEDVDMSEEERPKKKSKVGK
ncbi:unnamed protein product [Aspergillus oryzae]|uniref:Unnamed protein product n=2 Tax=Aspergillus oryzae TaxID=5062 RepID=A0AAN4YF20_ASPOZ|nr:unnamed protein product [Aspergillus oryzae]GMF87962.1 unnamed protein product [Aspergillus oryzae]GMG06460.1 unnamed protein product [Aspergillus oryzae]GMG24300.1 unnamed protein product [Aspergillus oryzae]GMG47578.1 unnamed protein product [Aspergillus oryzae var. brunneus]